MGVGEFIVSIILIVSVFNITNKVLKIVQWKLEYNMNVKKDMDAVNDFIHNDDLNDL